MAQGRPLRPMGVGDILDETIQLFRHNFVPLAGIAAVLQVPLIVLQLGQVAIVGPFVFDPVALSQGEIQELEALGSWGLSTIVLWIASAVCFLIVQAALARGISDRYLGHPIGVWSSYQAAISSLLRLFGSSVIMVLVLFVLPLVIVFVGGIVLLILQAPSVVQILLLVLFILVFSVFATYLAVGWTLFVPAIVLDGKGVLGALSRSRRLIKGSWWRVSVILLLAGIIYYIVALIPTYLIVAIISAATFLLFHGSTTAVIAGTAVGGIFQIIAAPLIPIVLTLLYYDLRIRKEGFDLQMLAEQLGGAEPVLLGQF